MLLADQVVLHLSLLPLPLQVLLLALQLILLQLQALFVEALALFLELALALFASALHRLLVRLRHRAQAVRPAPGQEEKRGCQAGGK